MALVFRPERTLHSGVRIGVSRASTVNGKTKANHIGFISSRKGHELLYDKLTEKERYELDNFISTLTFSKTHFKSDADELGRITLKVPLNFIQALFDLWVLAKEHDLDFIPHREMLYAVLRKAKVIELKLQQLLGKKINILEGLEVELDSNILPKEKTREEKKLFQAILKLDHSIEKSCEEFISIARKYGRQTNFKPHFFNLYAGQTGNADKKLPKWYYGVALELLHQYGVNPTTILSPQKTAEYWARLHKEEISSKQALKIFTKVFDLPAQFKEAAYKGIASVYKQSVDQ